MMFEACTATNHPSPAGSPPAKPGPDCPATGSIVPASDSERRWAGYQHGWREAGLSDHSAPEVIFERAWGNLEN